MLEEIYISLIRCLRPMAAGAGLISYLDRHRSSRASLYLRSLFAVRDIEDMVSLDVPWWCFAAIDRIESFLGSRNGSAKAFEYGPGASTFWLARRCQTVALAEHDCSWWQTFEPMLATLPNVTGALYQPRHLSRGETTEYGSGRKGWRDFEFKDYVEAIESAGGPFDLIIIDGRARSACLAKVERHLATGGMIVFDNSNRRRYRTAIGKSKLVKKRYCGLTPASPHPTETTILFSDPRHSGSYLTH